MPISDNEELTVNIRARPSSDSVAGVPIKKRHFMIAQSPSPPSRISSSMPDSSFSEIGNQLASGNTMAANGTSESRVESVVSRDLNIDPGHEILPRFDQKGPGLNLVGKGVVNMRELIPDNKFALLPAVGSTQPIELPTHAFLRLSGSTEIQNFKDTFELPKDGQDSEGCSMKQEKLDSCSLDIHLAEKQKDHQTKCCDAVSRVDCAHLCPDRSKWDLNTLMDTWEGSSSDSAVNNGTGKHEEPDRTDATLGKYMLDRCDHIPKSSILSSPMIEGCNSEACLDLRLKPSVIAESFFKWGYPCPLGKLDSSKEMAVLSLFPSSVCNPSLGLCTTVKAEPCEESSRKDTTRKVEAGNRKSVGLKHVKYGLSELQESCKIIGSGDLKSSGSRAAKPEPVEDPGMTVGKALELVTLAPIPPSTEIHHSGKVTVSTDISHGKGIVSESTDLVEKSLVSEGKQLNLVGEAFEMAGMDSELPPKSFPSDDKEQTVASADVTESSGGEIGASSEVIDKQFGDDNDYEDGEVRDPALHSTIRSSCEERKKDLVKDADTANTIFPADIPVELPSCVDSKEDKIENSVELKIHDTVGCVGLQCGSENDQGISMASDLHESSAAGVRKAGPGTRRLGKTIRKIHWDHLKEKAPKTKPKCDPLLSKASVSSKAEIKDDAGKHGKHSGSPKLIVNQVPAAAPDGIESGKTKYIPGGPISSQVERKRLIEKSLRRDKSLSRGIRDKHCSSRSWIFQKERFKDQPVGRQGPDFICRRVGNQLNAQHGDPNYDHDRVLEQVNTSFGVRSPRPMNASEFSSDGSMGNAGRMARKLTDQNLSNMSCRRRSPGERGRIPVRNEMPPHPTRDIGSDAPDFALRAHQEKLMRTFPDDMAVLPHFSRRQPQYERAEGSLVHRERSLSPIDRRGPVHFPPICSGSSPRSQALSHHQWFPPRRSLDGFDGPPELINCRSPRGIRPDTVRSPHPRLRLADDMIVRRRFPPHIDRLPDDVDDICHSREQDFPSPVGGLRRNIRRFDTINPREISEEEYFGSFPHNQFGELAGDDEFVDRNCRHERRVLGRSFRQPRCSGDEDIDNFRPPGPFGFCPDGDGGFPERGSPRDFNGSIRNRLGNPAGRLRDIEEQEDNYRNDCKAGFRDAGYNDVRPKRRRFERH